MGSLLTLDVLVCVCVLPARIFLRKSDWYSCLACRFNSDPKKLGNRLPVRALFGNSFVFLDAKIPTTSTIIKTKLKVIHLHHSGDHNRCEFDEFPHLDLLPNIVIPFYSQLRWCTPWASSLINIPAGTDLIFLQRHLRNLTFSPHNIKFTTLLKTIFLLTSSFP